MMSSLNRLVNASLWPSVQAGHYIIYSADSSLLNKLKTQTKTDKFWRETYTSFAAIVVNTQNQQVIAVRDHFGVEPFYYAQHEGQFIFGSTLPDILKHLSTRPAWNTRIPLENLLWRMFERKEVYTDETYYQSIYRVTPGHELHLQFMPTEIVIQKINFWDLRTLSPASIHYPDERDYLVHFTELLKEAICVHDVGETAAIELSGGLDSSAVLFAA